MTLQEGLTAIGLALVAIFNAWQAARSKQAAQDTGKRLEGGNTAFAELRQTDLAQGERLSAVEVRLGILERLFEIETMRKGAGPTNVREE